MSTVSLPRVRNRGDTMRPGDVLFRGDALRTKNGGVLLMQEQGNLVLYAPGPGGYTALWWSHDHATPATKAVLERDGNFYLLDDAGKIYYSANSKGAARLVFQTDGNAVWYARNGRPIAYTVTGGWHVNEGLGPHKSGGFLKSIGHALSSAASAVAAPVRLVGKEASAGIHAVEHATAKIPGVGAMVHVLATVSGASLAANLASGARIDHAIVADVKDKIGAAREAAPYVALVASGLPGIGTGIAGAISVGTALAEGRRIDRALLDGVRGAIPGGAASQIAFDVARGLLDGKSISSAALEAARNQIPAGAARVAFDTGVALMHGKSIQDAAAAGAKALAGQAIASVTPANLKAALGAIGHGVAPSAGALNVATLAAAGKAAALAHPALAMVRGAIPGGIGNRVGFDLAVSVGKHPALRGVREVLKTAGQRAAFDAAVVAIDKVPHAEILAHAERTARANPAAAQLFAKAALTAQHANVGPLVHEPRHRAARARTRARPLSRRAKAWVSDAVRRKAAGALSKETRGLDAGGRMYTVDPGDSAWRIAQNLTGDGSAHFRELISANAPPKLIRDSADPVRGAFKLGAGARVLSTYNFASLKTGEKLVVPPTWKLKNVIPVASVGGGIASPVRTAAAPAPVATTVSTTIKSPVAAAVSSTHEVTPQAGETWDIYFETDRTLSGADADMVKTKFTAAMVKPGDTAVSYSFDGKKGCLRVLYGNAAVLNVGMSARVSVEAGSPFLTLTSAVQVAGAAAAPSSGGTPTGDDPNAIAQAKVILVAWEHTDGLAAAGLPDYGGKSEDVSPIWGSRDNLELMAFCAWANAAGAALPLVGDLTQQKLDALVAWSENKAKAAAPGGAMVVSAPSTAPAPTPAAPVVAASGTVQTMPETEITANPIAQSGPGDSKAGLFLLLGLGGIMLVAATSKKSKVTIKDQRRAA